MIVLVFRAFRWFSYRLGPVLCVDPNNALDSVVQNIALVTSLFGLKTSADVPSALSPISPSWHANLAYFLNSSVCSSISLKLHCLEVSGSFPSTFMAYSDIILERCALINIPVRLARSMFDTVVILIAYA